MLMRNLFLWLFLTIGLFADTLEIESKSLYKTKAYIEYTLAEELTEEATALSKREWSQNKEHFNTFKNRANAYWARLKIKNRTTQHKQYYLKSENQFTYHIEFFLLKGGEVADHIEDGAISKNQNREFNTNHMIFPVTLAPHEEVEVLFKIRNYNKIDIDFMLVTKEYLLDFYQTYNIFEGIFFGGMLMMMFYNLFLYFLLKHRAYLYYVLYTFWLSVYFAGLFGFSQRYFAGYTWIFYISSGAFFVSMTLFVSSILNLKEQLPKIDKILNIFIFYFILATFINIIMLESQQFLYAQLLFNLFFMLVPIYITIIIFVTYYLAYVQKDSVAKIYSWVWTLVSFSGLLLPLVYLNIIETDIPSDYIFQFLTLFEVLCFSFILAYKIKMIQKEQSEQQVLLVEQNKLASMGEMISSIAHQWRQPLTEINGVVLNMDMDYRKKQLTAERFDKHLNDIENVTSYLSKTIHDFMNLFSHKKELEIFYISDVIRSSKRLSHISLNEEITFIYDSERDFQLCGYMSELTQALLIVFHNAVDASKERGLSPVVTIDVESSSSLLYINIKDNGGGISEDILKDIFNPYFTTKHESQGTGLGLYILKMIIEESMHGSVKIVNYSQGAHCEIIIPLNLKQKRVN
jgi:signal transduction histidine kinase